MGQIIPFRGKAPSQPAVSQSSYYLLDAALGEVARMVHAIVGGERQPTAVEALSHSVVALLAHATARELEDAAGSLCVAAANFAAGARGSANERLLEDLEAAYLQLRVEILTATPLNWPEPAGTVPEHRAERCADGGGAEASGIRRVEGAARTAPSLADYGSETSRLLTWKTDLP